MAGLLCQPHLHAADDDDQPTDIGTRRELFIDRGLIENLTDGAQQQLHHPIPREISIEHNQPWEGTGCGYHSVFQDGDLYRMYYKSWHLGVADGKLNTGGRPLCCCYAESDDGIHWRKPNLGLNEFQGSKENNIVMLSVNAGTAECRRQSSGCVQRRKSQRSCRCSLQSNLPFQQTQWSVAV